MASRERIQKMDHELTLLSSSFDLPSQRPKSLWCQRQIARKTRISSTRHGLQRSSANAPADMVVRSSHSRAAATLSSKYCKISTCIHTAASDFIAFISLLFATALMLKTFVRSERTSVHSIDARSLNFALGCSFIHSTNLLSHVDVVESCIVGWKGLTNFLKRTTPRRDVWFTWHSKASCDCKH